MRENDPRHIGNIVRDVVKNDMWTQHSYPKKAPERRCDKHNVDLKPDFWDTRFSWWTPKFCPQCEEERTAPKKGAKELQRERREAALLSAFKHSGIGEEFYKKRFKDFDSQGAGRNNALKAVREFGAKVFHGNWKDKKLWLLLHGTTGTGKTHLLAATMRALFHSGKRCAYYEGGTLIRAIKDRAYGSGKSDTMDEFTQRSIGGIIENMVGKNHLVLIDDYGIKPTATAYDQEVMYELFNTLHKLQLPVLISSNKPFTRWPVDDRVKSRIKERTREVEMRWLDYRQKEFDTTRSIPGGTKEGE